jgi:hypothetical protein
LIFNQYLNPIALKAIAWKYYVSSSLVAYRLPCVRYADNLVPLQLVYCIWLVFELAFVYFFIIETKGRSLEETAALFDGEEAEAAIVTHGAHGEHATEISEDYEKDAYASEGGVSHSRV